MFKKPKIFIGTLNIQIIGAIPTITKAFIDGLQHKYDFIPYYLEENKRGIHGKLKPSNLIYFIKHYIVWIYKILRFRPKIVHYPITSYWNLEKSLLFLISAKVLGVPFIIGHVHGGSFDDFWNKLGPIRKRIAKKGFNRLDVLIVLSKYWERFFENVANFKKIYEVNNLIDKNFEEHFLNHSRSYNSQRIFFLGSLGKRKGVYDIIESVKQFDLKRDITLIGVEEEKGDLLAIRERIRSNNLQDFILLTGPKYNDDKIRAFMNNGIFLFPSYHENLPLVVMEAACAGLPIISSPVGALPDFFENGKSIIFVEPGNIKQIRNAILELSDNEKKRAYIGSEAKKVYRSKFSRAKILSILDNIYSKL